MFDEQIDRAATQSSRWRGKDVLALTVGDTDFRIAEPIRQALEQRLAHGVLGYDSLPDAVYERFIARAGERYGWQVQRSWMTPLPGVVQALNLVCRAVTGPGQSIITETPVYYPFLDAPANAGRERRDLQALDSGRSWDFDLHGLESLCRQPDTRLLLLCHPQNPLGRVFDRELLAAIADICAANDVVICSDEIHCDLLFDGARHVPMASVSKAAADITVTLVAPTKAFSISGLGGSFAIMSNPDLQARFREMSAGIVPGLNIFTQVAMQAAWETCDNWLAEQLIYLQENRDYLVRALGELGIGCYLPGATYFLWLDFRTSGLNDPWQDLVDGGVELSDGARFGQAGFLRLNFASPRSRLEEAVNRIAAKLSA
ncbi:MAG: PatB family C-S lyase [Proteobacteria bacterium]|nr:PatB family C-S lyase [Pseudomonadota bacterium]